MTYCKFPGIGKSYIFSVLFNPAQGYLSHFFSHILIQCLFLSSLTSSAMSVLLAYQLRVCQPPPEVPNADILMEDGELEIGELSVFLPYLQTYHFDGRYKLWTSYFPIVNKNHQDHILNHWCYVTCYEQKNYVLFVVVGEVFRSFKCSNTTQQNTLKCKSVLLYLLTILLK